MTAGRPLLLLGAGGLAREVLAAVRAAAGHTAGYASTHTVAHTVVGMFDDDPARHGTRVDGVPVLGPLDTAHDVLADDADAQVVSCVASPARRDVRARVARRLALPDDRWATVVHPSASVPAGVVLGHGCVLLAHTVITAPQTVGPHVLAMPHVLLTHDDAVGAHVCLAGRATLAGEVTVGDGAYVGAGALVRERVTIGAGALVGMGSVVLRDVPPGETWAGSPARPLTRSGVAAAPHP